MQKTWSTRGACVGTVCPFAPLLFWTMWMHYQWKKTKYKKGICYYRALWLSPSTKHRVWHLTDVQIPSKTEPKVRAYISIILERGVVSGKWEWREKGGESGKEEWRQGCMLLSWPQLHNKPPPTGVQRGHEKPDQSMDKTKDYLLGHPCLSLVKIYPVGTLTPFTPLWFPTGPGSLWWRQSLQGPPQPVCTWSSPSLSGGTGHRDSSFYCIMVAACKWLRFGSGDQILLSDLVWNINGFNTEGCCFF